MPGAPTPPPDPSTGQLVSQLSTEISRLVRDELQLAQLEVTGKAKKAGIGVGMFGAAGLVALYGLGVLLAAIVLALALVVDAWLAALIVAVVLFAIAGVAALLGKKQVSEASPPVPRQAMANVKEDIDAVRNPAQHSAAQHSAQEH
ncbi:phage holin family protein [Nocardioides sp. Y6]|uniref:Phage holin family protein n=1 Tax=Nocardioides malaquae TaxID=2773426 RepID=A0ABR9RQH0_9ACTN|nr:phage holin family protein [Nocardioides malaquae]